MVRWVVCVGGVAVGLLVVPTVSHAVDYRGETAQGKRALVRAAPDGQDPRITIAWTARCRGPGVRWRDGTEFRPPYRGGSPGRVGDDGAYRQRSGRVVGIITIHMRARRVSPHRWRGTFRAAVVVRRRGRVIDRCRMRRRTRWNATIPRAAFDMTSDEGELLGGGRNYSFRSPDDQVIAAGTRELIQVRAGGYVLAISKGPSRTGLRPGRYVDRTVNHGRSNPTAISVSGRGRSCDSMGEFTITELSFSRRGRLRNLALTFEHRCAHAPGALRGSISFRR